MTSFFKNLQPQRRNPRYRPENYHKISDDTITAMASDSMTLSRGMSMASPRTPTTGCCRSPHLYEGPAVAHTRPSIAGCGQLRLSHIYLGQVVTTCCMYTMTEHDRAVAWLVKWHADLLHFMKESDRYQLELKI